MKYDMVLGRLLKRFLDVLVSLAALIAIGPLALVIALVIKMDDGGPIFFRQVRIGRHGKQFTMYKFRSMVPVAPSAGPPLTVSSDARVTRAGRFLRRWKLDELPQFINVLLGSMSLVGPRPEVPAYVALYSPSEREVLRVRPGLTDPATIQFRHEEEVLARQEQPEAYYRSVLMKQKLAINLSYLDRATVWSDFGVLARTLVAVVWR